MKRRLLTIGHSYVVEQNRRLAHEIARAGTGAWDVTVAAPRFVRGEPHARQLEAGSGEESSIRPLTLRLGSHPHARFFSGGLRALLREGWDVVHVWQEPYVLAAAQISACAPGDARVVPATFQNLRKRYPAPVRMIERRVMSRADGWIAFGRTAHEALAPRAIYSRLPARVIPPGVDPTTYAPNRERGLVVRARLRLDPATPVIGFIGRLVPEKGLHILLDALEALRTPWQALMLGRGPLEDLAARFARRHAGRVRVVTDAGHGDVPAYLNAMDVLCAPSQTTAQWREQFGRMLIESLACGVPVIGSRSGEIPHVLGDAGVLVPESDSAAWTAALAALLQDDERRRRLTEAGLHRVASRFSWAVVARQHLEFFEELVSGAAA